jgi:hypothetical protein
LKSLFTGFTGFMGSMRLRATSRRPGRSSKRSRGPAVTGRPDDACSFSVPNADYRRQIVRRYAAKNPATTKPAPAEIASDFMCVDE